MREVVTTDYHTAGEPFRIVVEGGPALPAATVAGRRELAAASEEAEAVRRLLCNEPRGHADMYGCFLVPPDDDCERLMSRATVVARRRRPTIVRACSRAPAWPGRTCWWPLPCGRAAPVDGFWALRRPKSNNGRRG